MTDMDETDLTEQDNDPSTNGDNGPATSPAEGLAEFRDDKGRFLPGNPGGPGNPQAHNVGAWRMALADSVSADDIAQVMGKLVEAAKAGAAWAVRELFDRCFGKPHVQVEFEADVRKSREWTEAERAEARRLARILIEEQAYGVEGAAERRRLRRGLPADNQGGPPRPEDVQEQQRRREEARAAARRCLTEGRLPGAEGASPPTPPGVSN